MKHTEPMIASVVTNPTNRDLKYTWMGPSGTYVKAGTSVTVPYDVYTAASSNQRAQLAQAIETKMVKVTYQSRGVPVEQVKEIVGKTVYSEHTKANKAKPAPAKEEPKKDEPAEEVKEPRKDIINAVADGKDALKDGEDLVQKATGQKTIGMRDALGWEPVKTEDPREEQKVEDVKMNDALTENMGDPLQKAAEKNAADEAAAAAKRSAASKKAAATRKKNADAKKDKAAKKPAAKKGDKKK